MNIVKACVLFLILMMVGFGCGNEKSKISGTYVYEGETETASVTEILELNPDDSYVYIHRLIFRPIYNPLTGTDYQPEPFESKDSGEWWVVKEKGEIGVDFLPPQALILRKSKSKGYYFYNLDTEHTLEKR